MVEGCAGGSQQRQQFPARPPEDILHQNVGKLAVAADAVEAGNVVAFGEAETIGFIFLQEDRIGQRRADNPATKVAPGEAG